MKLEEATDYDFEPDVRVAGPHGGGVRAGVDDHRRAHARAHLEPHVLGDRRGRRAVPRRPRDGVEHDLVSPPDGDMTAYTDSLRKVAGRADVVHWPTHGPAIPGPQRYAQVLVRHREQRDARCSTRCVVGGGDRRWWPCCTRTSTRSCTSRAARAVLSHLVKLVEDGQVVVVDGGQPRLKSVYAPA